jgi:exodeoxyribonuclease VII small subunit
MNETPMQRTPSTEAPPAAAPTPPTRTYESAVSRVEEIIRRLDSGEAGLRETLDLVREGRALVEYCATELDAVSQGLEELRLEELVARLEPTPPAPHTGR